MGPSQRAVLPLKAVSFLCTYIVCHQAIRLKFIKICPYTIFVQRCGKRCDFPKYADELMNLEFPRLL